MHIWWSHHCQTTSASTLLNWLCTLEHTLALFAFILRQPPWPETFVCYALTLIELQATYPPKPTWVTSEACQPLSMVFTQL